MKERVGDGKLIIISTNVSGIRDNVGDRSFNFVSYGRAKRRREDDRESRVDCYSRSQHGDGRK